MAEGYFTWLLRTAVMILFFYVVLGTAQHFATGWNASITAACAADAKGVCTHPIQSAALVSLLGSAVVLAFICIGVPFTAAHIVSGGVSMALEHLAAAKYLAAGSGRHIASAVANASRQISKAVHSSTQRSTLEQRMAAGAAAAAKNATSPTQRLNGSNGQTPGYNMRPPSNPPAPRTPLPPSPNNGSGGGGAALEYYPGTPGAKTKAEAVDITKLQKK